MIPLVCQGQNEVFQVAVIGGRDDCYATWLSEIENSLCEGLRIETVLYDLEAHDKIELPVSRSKLVFSRGALKLNFTVFAFGDIDPRFRGVNAGHIEAERRDMRGERAIAAAEIERASANSVS